MGSLITEGVYLEVPNEEYHDPDGPWGQALNASTIKILQKRPPVYVKTAKETPREEKQAFIIGSAVHARCLEKDRFYKEYVRVPKIDRRTTAGKEEWRRLCARHATEFLLKEEDYDLVEAMGDSVERHKVAGPLLEAIDDAEVSCAFKYRDVVCKVRYDSVNFRDECTVDIKTTRDANPKEFEKSILDFGYHIQAALYLQAAKELGLAISRFIFVAVEKTPPFSVTVHELPEEYIRYGMKCVDEAVDRYKYCREKNTWPGYEDVIYRPSLPEFAQYKLEGNV